MIFGEKMAGIKEAFCIFNKKRSFEEPLKFYFTVQEFKNISNKKY